MHGRARGRPVRRFFFGAAVSTAALGGWALLFGRYLAQPLGVVLALQSPRNLMVGVVHHATVALLAGLLAWIVRDKSYVLRALTVFVAGLLGTSFVSLANPIWFRLPGSPARGLLVYEGVAWLLLALLVSGIAVGRKKSSPTGLIMSL